MSTKNNHVNNKTRLMEIKRRTKLIRIQNPRGHKEGRASFPIQSQYKDSKIHSSNPTLEEKGRKNRREGERDAWEKQGDTCSVPAKGARERERGGEGVFNPNNSQPKRLNYP